MTRFFSADGLRLLIPALSLVGLLAAVFYLQPRAMSYTGLNLLFNLAVPIALATIAQMLIMTVNDLDLSMGTFVSFVACVTATFLQSSPILGALILIAAICVYALCCLTHRSGLTGNIRENVGSIEKSKEFSGLGRLKRRGGADRFDRADFENLQISTPAG